MVLGAGKLHNSDTESQLSHISSEDSSTLDIYMLKQKRIYKNTQEYTRIYKNIQEYTRIYKNIQ